jgi:hypothetical protein
MLDVLKRSHVEVVEADHSMALFKKIHAQMRTQKARPSVTTDVATMDPRSCCRLDQVSDSESPTRAQHGPRGAQDDRQVEPKRPRIDVTQIEAHHLGKGCFAAAAHLP